MLLITVRWNLNVIFFGVFIQVHPDGRIAQEDPATISVFMGGRLEVLQLISFEDEISVLEVIIV